MFNKRLKKRRDSAKTLAFSHTLRARLAFSFPNRARRKPARSKFRLALKVRGMNPVASCSGELPASQ